MAGILLLPLPQASAADQRVMAVIHQIDKIGNLASNLLFKTKEGLIVAVACP
jgi:hypothetical protein